MIVPSRGDRPSRRAVRADEKNDQTKPSARLAVDRVSEERPRALKRSQGVGAEAPKAHERSQQGGEDPGKSCKRSHLGHSGPGLSPRESAKTENSPKFIPPSATLHPPPASGILHTLDPFNGRSTCVVACSWRDSGSAGCSRCNGSDDSAQEARITRREGRIGSDDSSVS